MTTKPPGKALLLVAFLFLAVICVVIACFMTMERLHLLHEGEQTTGTVIRIDTGVKGLKAVVVEYKTLTGDKATGIDVHKTQWFSANDVGDRVSLFYDPAETENILVERGPWMWLNPGILFAGGVFLLVIGVFVYKQG